MLTERAYAKINLFLDVTGRRGDGFHNIKSVMSAVSLSDTLYIDAEKSDKVEIFLETNSKILPTGVANLVHRAALLYLSTFGIMARVKIKLEKNIPIGAGLAGGSADAAATLRAMNRMFALATDEQLLGIAERLGSDVPFCLVGGTALCEGRGEKITPLRQPELKYLVIAIGESRVSTPEAYARLDELYSDFETYAPRELDITSLLAGGDGIGEYMYNVFEMVATAPEIVEIKEIMADCGAKASQMSGSGPAVFGIFSTERQAKEAYAALRDRGFGAFVTSTVI